MALASLENRCQNKYQRTSKGRHEDLDDCENEDQFRKEVEVLMNGEYLDCYATGNMFDKIKGT